MVDTNLAAAIAEALKQIPVSHTVISDATWQMLLQVIMAVIVAFTAWRTHSTAQTTKRIEKDVNSSASALAATAAAMAEDKKVTVEKILQLSKENAAMKEQVRSSFMPSTVQSAPLPVPNPIPLPLPITIVEAEEKEGKPKYTDLDPKKDK